MIVYVSTHLHGYTGGKSKLTVDGVTVADVLENLESMFPGVRFRVVDEQGEIREHIRFFLNAERIDRLDLPVKEMDELHILGALSGG
ncbi:MAG: MoaD/ThiS family protein [Candidatus Eisenbacteria bacterium]|uniref:MoaD/ThiS family protein n=1 Tax=Eiseniibacteriota bacterium TaxID=2212470 RepID=A0A956RQK7_UNCEI|nr:MoaD/ThiS family protein [Candidatus Eisenbacteria bacterium]